MLKLQIKPPLDVAVDAVIENIQEAIVMAGGRFIKQQEIREMTVEELLLTTLTNQIKYIITYRSDKQANTVDN